VSEAIDPAGDVDIYELAASKGDYIDIRFQLLDEGGYGGLTALLSRARDDRPEVVIYSGPGPVPTLDQVGSGRFTIEETGRYRLAVMSSSGGSFASERGRYRMMVRQYPGTPEYHAARLVLGDSVTDEPLDPPGDVDEFTLEGQPGVEFGVYLTA